VEFYLADFQFTDNAFDYILDGWTWVDLSSLGSAVKTLEFALSSSDTGMWGMNTPAYFALDNLLFATRPPTTIFSFKQAEETDSAYCAYAHGRHAHDQQGLARLLPNWEVFR